MKLVDEGTVRPRPEDVREGGSIPFNQVITTLEKCGRCGERHRNAVWREYKTGPVKFDGRVAATHWTVCPIMKEPVLGLLLTGENL